jgi:peroxiredoxin
MRGKTLQRRSTFPRFGSLVIDKDGRVKARFDPDFRHRMAIEDILGALATIEREDGSGRA